MNRKAKKLTLSRDTILQLESRHLGQVVGEAKPRTAWTVCQTCGSCAQTCTPGCIGSQHTCITICPCTP